MSGKTLTTAELADELSWLRIASIVYEGDPVGLANAEARRSRKRARKYARRLFWRRLFRKMP